MSYSGRSWSAIDLQQGRDMDSHEGRDSHDGRDRGRQTWAGAARDVWRAAARHQGAPGLIALAARAPLIALAPGPPGAAPRAPPARAPPGPPGPGAAGGPRRRPGRAGVQPAGPRPVNAEDLAQRLCRQTAPRELLRLLVRALPEGNPAA